MSFSPQEESPSSAAAGIADENAGDADIDDCTSSKVGKGSKKSTNAKSIEAGSIAETEYLKDNAAECAKINWIKESYPGRFCSNREYMSGKSFMNKLRVSGCDVWWDSWAGYCDQHMAFTAEINNSFVFYTNNEIAKEFFPTAVVSAEVNGEVTTFARSDVGLAVLKHVVPTNDGVPQTFLKRGDVRDLMGRFSTKIKESANFKLGEVKLPVAKIKKPRKKAKGKAAAKGKATATAAGKPVLLEDGVFPESDYTTDFVTTMNLALESVEPSIINCTDVEKTCLTFVAYCLCGTVTEKDPKKTEREVKLNTYPKVRKYCSEMLVAKYGIELTADHPDLIGSEEFVPEDATEAADLVFIADDGSARDRLVKVASNAKMLDKIRVHIEDNPPVVCCGADTTQVEKLYDMCIADIKSLHTAWTRCCSAIIRVARDTGPNGLEQLVKSLNVFNAADLDQDG